MDSFTAVVTDPNIKPDPKLLLFLLQHSDRPLTKTELGAQTGLGIRTIERQLEYLIDLKFIIVDRTKRQATFDLSPVLRPPRPPQEKTSEELYHELQQAAWKAVGEALASGQLSKPTTCEQCHQTRRLYAHHDDYFKALDVRWLCGSCHSKNHVKSDVILSVENDVDHVKSDVDPDEAEIAQLAKDLRTAAESAEKKQDRQPAARRPPPLNPKQKKISRHVEEESHSDSDDLESMPVREALQMSFFSSSKKKRETNAN